MYTYKVEQDLANAQQPAFLSMLINNEWKEITNSFESFNNFFEVTQTLTEIRVETNEYNEGDYYAIDQTTYYQSEIDISIHFKKLRPDCPSGPDCNECDHSDHCDIEQHS